MKIVLKPLDSQITRCSCQDIKAEENKKSAIGEPEIFLREIDATWKMSQEYPNSHISFESIEEKLNSFESKMMFELCVKDQR